MTAAVAHTAQTAPATKRPAATKTSPRPRLRVLDQTAVRRRARRRNAVLLLFIIVLSALFLVAFVHARLVESQQELDLMRSNIAELETEKARIERAVDEASAPSLIVERATGLGMIRAENPVFIIPVESSGGDTVASTSSASTSLASTRVDGTLDSTAEIAGGEAQPGVLAHAALGDIEDG